MYIYFASYIYIYIYIYIYNAVHLHEEESTFRSIKARAPYPPLSQFTILLLRDSDCIIPFRRQTLCVSLPVRVIRASIDRASSLPYVAHIGSQKDKKRSPSAMSENMDRRESVPFADSGYSGYLDN